MPSHHKLTRKTMNTPQIPEPPKPTKSDTVHAIIGGGLSLLPAGLAELFDFFVAPPIEKRRQKWEEEITKIVKFLKEQKSFDVDSLTHNEAFKSILIQTTIAAYKTHQDEKLAALRNALGNAALG